MSSRLVLVDSSAWITHFTGRDATLSRRLQELLLANRAAINAIIRLELLTGANNEAQYAELDDALRGLPLIELSAPVWAEAERLRFRLRRAGHLIPVPDVVIGACAIIHQCELFHGDRHFDVMARRTPLRVYAPAR
jgi:predicted nucleic acid-binding protein